MRHFLLSHFRELTRRLAHDRKGSILPLFGVLVIMVVVISGAAFDVARTVNAREKLSYALDAAALSLASDLSTTDMNDAEIQQALEDSFRANLDGVDFLQEAINNLDFDLDSENGIVTVWSSATLANYFVDFGGYMMTHLGPETFAFGTRTQVTYSRFDVELSLVLDVTGSMSADMETLRNASFGLVNILIPDGTDEADSKVRISLVPYSEGVNLGTYADAVKGRNYGYGNGNDCVTERIDYDDGTEVFEVAHTDAAYDYYDKADPPPAGTFYGGGSSNCPSDSEFIPLSSNRTTLTDAIEALDDNGSTAGQTGITWGWNSLSPNFANLWPSDSEPAPYDDDDVLKFAVIMTDGDNNRHYEFTESVEKCSGFWIWRTCWMEEVNQWNYVGDSGYNGASSQSSRALCENMKAAGIRIFGVYFGNNNNSTGARNMQSCASEGRYYQATSAAALIGVFANIAKTIQQIYVSK